MDSCRVWESHSERESSSDAGRDWDSLGESDESRNVRCLQTKLQELPACSGMGSRVPVSVVGVDSGRAGNPQKVEKGDGQLAPLEAISSLVAQLLRTAQDGQQMDGKAPLEGKLSPLSAVSPGPGTERGHSVKEWVRVCFSCGRQGHGHGVNDVYKWTLLFHFCHRGGRWMANIRRHGLTELDWGLLRETRDGPSGIEVRLTPAGELLVPGDASRLRSCRWGVGSDLTGL